MRRPHRSASTIGYAVPPAKGAIVTGIKRTETALSIVQ